MFLNQIAHVQEKKIGSDGIRMFSWTRLANPLKMSCQLVTHFSTAPPPNAKFWTKLFGKYLLLTNTIGSGLLLAIGDAIAQQYERFGEKKAFDYSRSGCMMITGSVIGPIQHGFYLLLDGVLPSTSGWGVLHKILVDQLIMSPIYIFLFFYVSSLLGERLSWSAIASLPRSSSTHGCWTAAFGRVCNILTSASSIPSIAWSSLM